VDGQLEEWHEKFPGKELRVTITWEYSINESHATPDIRDIPANEANNGVTVRGSTTVNMLRDLDDALQGNASVDVWQQIHALWRRDG
jgi:hypothetical protein